MSPLPGHVSPDAERVRGGQVTRSDHVFPNARSRHEIGNAAREHGQRNGFGQFILWHRCRIGMAKLPAQSIPLAIAYLNGAGSKMGVEEGNVAPGLFPEEN